ncbi:MAG: CotH kinase family protein [Treponema sp.]|nr:CotH kinase family protein [Treponema sp.]
MKKVLYGLIGALFLFGLISGCKFNTSGSGGGSISSGTSKKNTDIDGGSNGRDGEIDVYVPETKIEIAEPPETPEPSVIIENEIIPQTLTKAADCYSKDKYNGKPILTVTPRSDGLYIVKNHDSAWIYVNIHVYDVENGRENASISTNEKNNEFLYPFVKKDGSYKVYITKQEEGYTNWASTFDEGVEVKAIGGMGNFSITKTGYSYDSPSYSIILKDLTITSPAGIDESLSFSGNFCNNGVWSGESIWSNGFKLNKSALSLTKISSFLIGQKKIFASIDYSFNYNGINYNENFISNDNSSLFEDTNQIVVYNPGRTGLPNVYLTTKDGKAIEKETWKDGTVKITSNAGNLLLDTTDAKLKGRGNSSWGTGKNPYTFKFDEKHKILGMKKSKRWVLLANYFDRSMLRNRLASYMGTKIFNSTWNASFEPANLYVNGVYCGTYDLGEQIKIESKRVNIQSMGDIKKSDYEDVNGDGKKNINDGGFLAEIDFRNGEKFNFYSDEYHLPFNLRDPDDNLSTEQFNYAKNKINAIERMLVADDFASNYKDYIDEASMIDWWLVNEFSRNNDAIFQTSVYMYYNPVDGKMYMGPGWDFDLGFGNDWDRDKWNEFYIYGGKKWKGEDDPDHTNPCYESFWLNRLFESDEFKVAAKARWQEKSDMMKQTVEKTIQEFADVIEPSIPCNEYILPRLGKESWNGPQGYEERTTYQSEVDYLIDWCSKRYSWIDTEISAW